jgi:hypothetical protein
VQNSNPSVESSVRLSISAAAAAIVIVIAESNPSVESGLTSSSLSVDEFRSWR